MPKGWRMLPPPPPGFANGLSLPPFQAHLLYNRGVRDRGQVESFLNSDSDLRNDPLLLPDMEKGIRRLERALRSGESIGVFGDFDTDGVTATALLTQALRDLGGTVVPYLPDRVKEGHGLNVGAIHVLRERGVTLLVTVDCGTTDVAEIGLASSLGMDTIITDHHSVTPVLPDASAVINPRLTCSAYPYPDLAGVGMSFKLVEALFASLGRERPDHLLELVALGTVADVAPLTRENRFFVKRGLEALNRTQNPGLQALAASAGLELGSLDAESLAFGLIPRLNVAGRLGDAKASLDLLTAANLAEAEPLAEELERKNYERQMMTARGVTEVMLQVEEAERTRGDVPPVVIIESEDWIPGILGLLAGRLADQLYRPVVAISLGQEVSRASARSIPEFDIVEALGRSRELFIRYGGHPQAAGFTILTSALPALKTSLTGLAEDRLKGKDLTPAIDIDCEVSPGLFAGDGMGFVRSLAPFGAGNPAPVFLTRNARVVDSRQVGGGGHHLKMRLSHGGEVWDAIAFRQGEMLDLAQDRIDLVYNVGLNTWAGRTKVQLTVLDFQPAR